MRFYGWQSQSRLRFLWLGRHLYSISYDCQSKVRSSEEAHRQLLVGMLHPTTIGSMLPKWLVQQYRGLSRLCMTFLDRTLHIGVADQTAARLVYGDFGHCTEIWN